MKLLPAVVYVTHRDTGAWNEDLKKIHNENTAKEILSMHISEFGLRVEIIQCTQCITVTPSNTPVYYIMAPTPNFSS